MLLISSPSTPFTSFNHIVLCLTFLCTVGKGDDSYPLSHWLTGINSFPPFKTFVAEQNLQRWFGETFNPLYSQIASILIKGTFPFYPHLYFVFFRILKNLCVYCYVGFSLLLLGFSSLQCMGFSLRWLLLLQRTGSRHMGFGSCGTWAQ